MEIKKYYNSEYIELNGKKYCPYCGQELKRVTEYDNHQEYIWYQCNCEDSIKAHDIELQISKLQLQMPSKKYMKAEVILPVIRTY